MGAASMAALVAASLSFYPALGDRPGGGAIPPGAQAARIEAVLDRGPIVELVVACRRGPAAIVTYSKGEGLYCTARHGCARDLTAAAVRTCR